MRKGNVAPPTHQLNELTPRRNNYPSFSDAQSHTFPRGNQGKSLLKKYLLIRPEKKDINTRMGAPDFFPLDVSAPEDSLKQKAIIEGLSDPKIVNDESSSLRKYFGNNGVNVIDLKTQLLQLIHEIEWKRSITPKEKERNKRLSTITSFPEQVVTSSQYREGWITRLAGTEALNRLAQQVPHGFKGDSLLKALMDLNIPILRATWFIKIIYLNMKQNRQKNPIDPTSDWTVTLLRFLMQQIKDFHSTKGTNAVENGERFAKSAYILKLIRWSYCESLLDKDKFLNFIVEQLSEISRADDVYVTIRVLLQYMDDIFASTVNSRRLHAHIHTRQRAGLRLQLQPLCTHGTVGKLDTVLQAIGHFLPADVHSRLDSSASQSQEVYFLDIPRVVEFLDQALVIADMEVVYNNIFPEYMLGPSSLIFLQDVESRIHLVCEWAVTGYRKNDFAACIVVGILKRCAHKMGELLHTNKLPLQAILTDFLEEAAHSTRTWHLYGELLRSGLFSHDGYVRYLISRGRLEGGSSLHRVILEQLPIFEYDINGGKRHSALHERNQRRAVLRGLSAYGVVDVEYDRIVTAAVEATILYLLGTGVSPIPLDLLHELTLHDKWAVAEWLVFSVMHSIDPNFTPLLPQHTCPLISNLLGIPSCTSEFIHNIFCLLRFTCSYHELAILSCWLLHHCVDDQIIFAVVSTSRDMLQAFIAQDMLAALLKSLSFQIQNSTARSHVSAGFFNELVTAYHEVSSVKWCEAKQTGVVEQKFSTDLERLWLGAICSKQVAMQHIAIVTNMTREGDNTLNVETVLRSAIATCSKVSADRPGQLAIFAALLGVIYLEFGPALLMEGLRNTLNIPLTMADQNVITELLATMVVRQGLPASLLISNVLAPILQATLPHLGEPKGLAQAEMLIFFIRTLLGHYNRAGTECVDEMNVYLQPSKIASLTTVFSPIIQAYALLLPTGGTPLHETPASIDGVMAILSDCDFIHVCITDATYIYEQLQTLNPQFRRRAFSMLSSNMKQMSPMHAQLQYCVGITRSNASEMGPKIVEAILDEVVGRHWIVQHGWLQLQLVLDEWIVVDPDEALQKFAGLMLGHLASNWAFYAVYSKLINLLGPQVQVHIARAALKVLCSQYSENSLAASLIELQYHIKYEPGVFSTEDGVYHSFVSLILASLKDPATSQLHMEYISSIESQLRRLAATPHLDFLSLHTQTLHAMQRSVWLRLEVLNSLYPLSRTLPDLASTLVRLVAKPFVYAGGEGGALAELIPHLLATITSLVKENDDTTRKLTIKMKEAYNVIRTAVPSQCKVGLENILSTPTTVNSVSHISVVDSSWTLLEDYPDGPLSPSQVGASRQDRKIPTYANQVFELAEPPLKRLRNL